MEIINKNSEKHKDDGRQSMIGIIGAMEQEVAGLQNQMTDKKVLKRASMEFVEGKIFDKEVVVVKCGVGKVNAGICTQILVDEYKVDFLINTGAAGSLCKDIDICDIVISTEALQHDMDSVDFGFELGQVPFLPLCYEADKDLIKLAEECCKEVNPDIHVYCGRVVSGDEFVAKKERKEWIKSHFQGLCTEMEGAAMAQAAYLNQVPFVIIRAISDKADDSAEMDFPTFSAKASERSIRLILRMLEKTERK